MKTIRTITHYGFDTETAADDYIKTLQDSEGQNLTKFSKERKVKTAKGEITDERWLVIAQVDTAKLFD